MPTAPLKPWEPAQPIEAKRLQAWQERTITDITVGPGLLLLRNGNSASIALAPESFRQPPLFPVRLTQAVPGGGLYRGRRGKLKAKVPIGTNLHPDDFLTFGTVDDCVVLNWAEQDSSTHGLAVGTTSGVVVWAGVTESTSSDGYPVFEIGGGAALSVGQYQYMDYTMVAQNVAGWDFARLHNLI